MPGQDFQGVLLPVDERIPQPSAALRGRFQQVMGVEDFVTLLIIDDVDYLETVTRRDRRGTSHGVSIRVARGLYYRPSTFRSRPIEWEETVHSDTGMLGLTTKHIYFAGSGSGSGTTR